MQKSTFKILALQLGIFLAYQLLIFFFTRRLNETYFVPAESIALSVHAFVLLLLSFIYFRRRETQKAIGVLLPFFIVLLIGMGSCFNDRYPHSSKSYESQKRRQDSIRKADSIRRLDEKSVSPEQPLH